MSGECENSKMVIESTAALDSCIDWLERVLCFPCRLCCKEEERLPAVGPQQGRFKPKPTSTSSEPTVTQPTTHVVEGDGSVPERDRLKPRPWPDNTSKFTLMIHVRLCSML